MADACVVLGNIAICGIGLLVVLSVAYVFTRSHFIAAVLKCSIYCITVIAIVLAIMRAALVLQSVGVWRPTTTTRMF